MALHCVTSVAQAVLCLLDMTSLIIILRPMGRVRLRRERSPSR